MKRDTLLFVLTVANILLLIASVCCLIWTAKNNQIYSPYMMWVFIATAGVWSIAMGIAIIIANKNEDKVKAKKMLVNYGIGLVVIFAILVAVPYLVQGIAALVAG